MIYSIHMKQGLAIALIFLSMAGLGCSKKSTESPLADCQNSQFHFACVLDKAMAAKDPSICAQVEQEKAMTCVAGYEEIIGSEVACEDLKNSILISDCKLERGTK